MKKKLAVLGCGNMGSAVALGLANASDNFEFFTYTPTQTKAKKLAEEIGGNAVQKVSDLKTCDFFLIACKPQQYGDLAKELGPIVRESSVLVSVMAGITVPTLKKLGSRKVARAMPNTPCLIGEGACGIFYFNLSEEEKKQVTGMFTPIAQVFEVASDDEIDMATAVIGSGPAYYFEITRIIADKLAALGIPKARAAEMTKAVAKGAAALMLQSSDTLEELRNKVTSKKGTTDAALTSFKKNQLEKIIAEGVEAAYKRAKELAT